ncbi:MAG: PAS domain S-box protein, partial [Sphingobacteriia bacterium]|nr:PAS domain S-box protein [Sphingobacteriia bacterium]
VTFDKRYRHRDGHLVYGEVASSLVRDHQGQPLYFISQVQDVTARRLAEAQLRASEERFRLVVEHAIDNIWTMGPDQHMRFLSPSIATLVGYGMEEYRELTLEQILMPDSLRVAAAYFAALDTRRAAGLGIADFPFRGELELRAKDGTGVWTEIIATPLVDAEGRLMELAGVTRDIRERKRYEDAIRQSERRFRLLLDSFSQIAVQGLTPEGTITFWNQANEPLYGYTAVEALGQDLVELIIPPEQRAGFREIIHQMASTGVRSPASEYSVIRKDGQRATVYANYAIIDVPGSGRELYCIDIDLTELRQTEEQLRISEERHRLLADHALDVIWTMGLDGTFHYLSPSIERLRGYTADELRRMPLEATFTPASWAIVQAGLVTARANVQAGLPVDFRAELEELRKDGSLVWTDVRATGIYGRDGRFIELLGVTRDISERKRYEAELQQARGAAEAANRALQAANIELQRLATTDRLTGLWNRHYFEEAMCAEMRRLARYSEQPLSLLLFDIDHFKSINDTHGHLVGDQVLSALTHRVRQHLRATDVLARWGGEEFVVLLPHTRGEDAVRLAENLRQLVAGEPFPEVGRVTLSLGVAEFQPDETSDRWLKRVDDALYAAKTAGRNRVVDASITHRRGETGGSS